MPQKIIIDTDPGVDDAMAIFFALKSPELDVLGLTSTFGNAHTALTTVNALRLIEIAGRPDIPVARGASHPLAHQFEHPADFVHGVDGQGNINLTPPTLEPVPESAAEFIVESVMAFPDEITLVAIGPLTNLALALRLEPRLAENVNEVVVMGGNAFAPGNATPTAEANIYNDPEAADVVFGADWQVTMVGLDVTMKCILTRKHLDYYGKARNKLAQHIHKIVPFYRDFIEGVYGIEGIHVHDSTAIAYLLAPDAFRTVRYPIRVETQGFGRGKTWISMGHASLDEPWRNRPKVNICVGIDSAKTLALEMERLIYNEPDPIDET